jgi:general secretion pathway protein M
VIERLSKTNQRRLAVALLTVLIGAVLLVTVLPVWSANATYQTRIDQIQEQLQELRADAAAGENLRPRFEQLRQSQLSDGHYLKSGTEAVAAAELQRIVKHIAGNNGTQVLSTQILPSSQEEDFVRVALKVRMRGTLTGIVGSIYDIESNATFLFMDKVSIRDSARRRSISQRISNQFDTDFDLIAYMPGERNES